MAAISVLMPVWNGCRNGNESFLRLAIESILDQTFRDIEFVIVDDGSTDNTPAILKQYASNDSRIKIIVDDRNIGIVGALNHGLRHCTSPLIARQDADDISTVTRLELQKKFLDDRPETAMCGTGMYVINEEGKLMFEIEHACNYGVIRSALKSGCSFVHGSVMYRKSVIDSLNGYSSDPRFQHAEDYELWVRMAKNHHIENIPGKRFYFHRDHSSKIGNIHRAQQENASRLIMQIASETL